MSIGNSHATGVFYLKRIVRSVPFCYNSFREKILLLRHRWDAVLWQARQSDPARINGIYPEEAAGKRPFRGDRDRQELFDVGWCHEEPSSSQHGS